MFNSSNIFIRVFAPMYSNKSTCIIFTWKKVLRISHVKVGDTAGCKYSKGYIIIKINKKMLKFLFLSVSMIMRVKSDPVEIEDLGNPMKYKLPYELPD